MQVSISTAQARRLLLYLQGLCEAPNRRLTPDGLYDLITRLGFVQVDSIRTVERAHHLTLLARNTRYHPDLLRILVEEDRRLFENWTHDASIIPTQWYPQWQPRFARERQRLRDRTSWQQRLGSDAQRTWLTCSKASRTARADTVSRCARSAAVVASSADRGRMPIRRSATDAPGFVDASASL